MERVIPCYSKNEDEVNRYLIDLQKNFKLHDSAVEIEIELKDEILGILTTTDGTLFPIINNERQLEELLKLDIDLFKKGYPVIENILWDDLSLINKREVLKTSTKYRGKSFKEDRTLHGIKVKEYVDLCLESKVEILGREYQSGMQKVELGKSFCLVEILSGGHVKNLEKIELHLRRDYPAGNMSISGQKILDALGVKRTHQHVHIVSKLPLDKLKNDPHGKVIELADNFRRANLVAEMRAIVLRKKTIYSKDYGEEFNFFKFLTKEIFSGVIDYLYNISKSNFLPIGDSLKKGWVGYRGHDKYDGDELLHGYEHRDIKPDDNLEESSNLLNATSFFLERYSSSDTPKRIHDWLNYIADEPREALIKCWYQKSWDELLKDSLLEVQDLVNGDLFKILKSSISYEKRGRFDYTLNFQVKLLIHNWSNDPIVFNDAKFEKKIKRSQIKALQRVNNLDDPLSVVRDFLIESSIYEEFNKSLTF